MEKKRENELSMIILQKLVDILFKCNYCLKLLQMMNPLIKSITLILESITSIKINYNSKCDINEILGTTVIAFDGLFCVLCIVYRVYIIFIITKIVL